MDEHPNALHLPELLDDCIHLLRDSTSDLTACALVARSWVYPAQSHLFAEVLRRESERVTDQTQWSKLLTILQTCPHLIPHVRRLRIDSLIPNTVSDICSLPFTNLVDVLITVILSNTSALAIQQLFSLPTLSSVDISCNFHDLSAFLQIWDRCSPSINSLALDCFRQSRDAFEPVPHHCVAPINLEALRIVAISGIADWLQHETCPFDFSRLRVLSVGEKLEILRWKILAPAFRTIEALEFEVGVCSPV